MNVAGPGGRSPSSQALAGPACGETAVRSSDELYRHDVLECGIGPARRTTEERDMRAIDRVIAETVGAVLGPHTDPGDTTVRAERCRDARRADASGDGTCRSERAVER